MGGWEGFEIVLRLTLIAAIFVVLSIVRALGV